MSSLSFKLRPTFLFSSKGDLVRVKKWLTEDPEPEPELNKVSTSPRKGRKVLIEKSQNLRSSNRKSEEADNQTSTENQDQPDRGQIDQDQTNRDQTDQTTKNSEILDLHRYTKQQKFRVKKLLDSRSKSITSLQDIFESLEETLDVLGNRLATDTATTTTTTTAMTENISGSASRKKRRMSEILDLSKLTKIRRKDLSLVDLVPKFGLRVGLNRIDQHPDNPHNSEKSHDHDDALTTSKTSLPIAADADGDADCEMDSSEECDETRKGFRNKSVQIRQTFNLAENPTLPDYLLPNLDLYRIDDCGIRSKQTYRFFNQQVPVHKQNNHDS